MKYSEEGTFDKTTPVEIKDVLEHVPKDYAVWVSNCDSIYPVAAFNIGILDDSVPSIASVETYGNMAPKFTVNIFLYCINMALSKMPYIAESSVIAEAAQDYDESLDLQLDSPHYIKGWGIDRTIHAFFLITGDCVE